MLYSIKQEEFDGRYPQFNGRTLRGRSSQCSGENIDTAELYLSDEAEEDEEKTTGTNNLRSD